MINRVLKWLSCRKLWWELVDITRFIFGRETRDEAWQDGYRQAEEDANEFIEGKEAWIAECENTIKSMMFVLSDEQWRSLPPEVQDHLRNFV